METVNRELGEINTWLCANKLFLNIDKHILYYSTLIKKNHSKKIETDGKTINEQVLSTWEFSLTVILIKNI